MITRRMLVLAMAVVLLGRGIQAAGPEANWFEGVPRLTMTGMRQDHKPQPVATVSHSLSAGRPILSPDGKWLVVTRYGGWSSHGQLLHLFDLQTRSLVEIKVPAPGVTGFATFNRQSTAIVAGVNTPEGFGLATWALSDREFQLKKLVSYQAIAAALNHAQDRVVIQRPDGVFDVFDLTRGEKCFEVRAQEGKMPSIMGGSGAIAISPDDEVVATGVIQPGNGFVLWRLADGSRVSVPTVGEYLDWGWAATYARDGQRIILAGRNGIRLLNSQTGETLARYGWSGGLEPYAYQPVQDLMAAPMDASDSFSVVEVASGQLRFWAKHDARPTEKKGQALWAGISPDGRWAHSADYRSRKIWDLGRELESKPDWLFAGRDTRRIAVVGGGTRLLALGDTLDTWDLAERRLIDSRSLAYLRLSGVADPGDPNERRRFIGSYRSGDQWFGIVASKNHAEILGLSADTKPLTLGLTIAQAWAKATRLLNRDGPMDDELRLAFEATQTEIFPRGVSTLDVSPDGKLLLVASSPAGLALWSLESGRLVRHLGGAKPRTTAAIFIDGGYRIAAGDEDGGLVLYDTRTGVERMRLPGTPVGEGRRPGSNEIVSLVLSPGGTALFTSDLSQRVIRWDRAGGPLTKRYECQLNTRTPIGHLAVSPGGTRFAACLSNGSTDAIVIGDADNGEVIQIVEDKALEATFLSETQLVSNGIRIWSLDRPVGEGSAP